MPEFVDPVALFSGVGGAVTTPVNADPEDPTNVFGWATVVLLAGPILTVQFDGHELPLTAAPDFLVPVKIGDRVWCQIYRRRCYVLGVGSAEGVALGSRNTPVVSAQGGAVTVPRQPGGFPMTLGSVLLNPGTQVRIDLGFRVITGAGSNAGLDFQVQQSTSPSGPWVAISPYNGAVTSTNVFNAVSGSMSFVTNPSGNSIPQMVYWRVVMVQTNGTAGNEANLQGWSFIATPVSSASAF